MKVYIVATSAAYTVLILAKNEKSAVNKANKLYKRDYGETREDWTAYDLAEKLHTEDFEAMPVQSWYVWEDYLRQNNIGGWHY